MKWKARQREIARLRRKHRVLCVNRMPDLSVDRSSTSYPSLTSSGGSSQLCVRRAENHGIPDNVVIGTPHKQGPMVMFRSELPWAGGKKS